MLTTITHSNENCRLGPNNRKSGRRWTTKRFWGVWAPLLFLISCLASGESGTKASRVDALRVAGRVEAASAYGRLPLSFESNQGQISPQVHFMSRGNGYSMYLTNTAVVLALRSSTAAPGRAVGSSTKPGTHQLASVIDVVSMQLSGANSQALITGAGQLPATANYFLGNDPAKWHTGVTTYSKVRYSQVYAGIDLLFYGNRGQLEYDFMAAPRANTKRIRLHFSGTTGLLLTKSGDLGIQTAHGEVLLREPVVYQDIDGRRRPVPGRFALFADRTVGFRLGRYDHSRAVVIDPTLTYSTYLGGSGGNPVAGGIAVDGLGNAYVTGATVSTDFPVSTGAVQLTNGTPTLGNAFVTKLNASGTGIVYSTYFGGTQGGGTAGTSVALDASGDAYITGYTFASDLPVSSGAFQPTFAGNVKTGANAFVAKLGPDGSALKYASYLGGSGNGKSGDLGQGIAVDGSNNAYVTGLAYSSDFPTTPGAYQLANNAALLAGSAAFITKINPGGSKIMYSTYLGGSGNDQESVYSNGTGDSGFALAIDSLGDAYVTGITNSTDFPVTPGAFQAINNTLHGTNVCYNGFISKLNPTGTSLVYSTYVGGRGTRVQNGNEHYDFCDSGDAIQLDPSGNAYVAGTTGSPDFPVTLGAFQSANKEVNSGRESAYILKLNATGTALLYSTYLGGTGIPTPATSVESFGGDSGSGLAVDSTGNAYVVGTTYSSDFPITKDALQSTNKGAANRLESAFLTELNPNGTALVYSTYLGGSAGESGHAVALGPAGNTYLTGLTLSTDFPVTAGAFQTTNLAATGKNANTYVSRLKFAAAMSLIATTTTLNPDMNPQTVGTKVTFTSYTTADSGTGTPTGTVTFSVDSSKGMVVPIDDTGHAAFATATLGVGSHTITAAYSGDSAYSPSKTSVMETITAPVLTVAATPTFSPAAGSYTSAQSVAISDATTGAVIFYTTDGSMPTTSSTMYAGAINVGASTTIKAFATAPGYGNSSVATAGYTIQLSAANFSVTVAPVALKVTAQQPATAMVSVTPLNGFHSPITFSCMGLPEGTSCSFSPASITPAGAAASTVLTISKGAATSAETQGSGMLLSGGTLAAGLCCLGFGKRRRKHWLLSCGLVLFGLTMVTGCGGGSHSSTSTVTITATGGALQHAASLTLTTQ